MDDIICVSDNPKHWIDILQISYRLRDVGLPTKFLGSNIKQWKYNDDNGIVQSCWALGSETYIKEACKVAEEQMKLHDLHDPSSRRHGSNSPFSSSAYRPELDATLFCDNKLTAVYQTMLGVLRWIVELGRIDILHEVSLLSQYLVQPRQGHLSQACNIFRYLKNRNTKGYVMMDQTKWHIEWNGSADQVYPRQKAKFIRELYPDAKQMIPYDMPEPLGESVFVTCFVDADHAGNRITRRSHTCIIK